MRWLVVCAAFVAAGCTALWPDRMHVLSAKGDTIAIEIALDAHRLPPAFKTASTYCASRQKTAVLQSSRREREDVLLDTYVCQ